MGAQFNLLGLDGGVHKRPFLLKHMKLRQTSKKHHVNTIEFMYRHTESIILDFLAHSCSDCTQTSLVRLFNLL